MLIVNHDNDKRKIELEILLSGLKQKKDAVFEYCSDYDPAGYPNMKAMWIIGEEHMGKPTKVFAYIGFPENASKDNPVPGMVLQHGGGGRTFPSWIKEWTDRGYAAIAIANTGYYPVKPGITDFYNPENWTRELRDDDYVLPPDFDNMTTSMESFDKQWMYHAVSQTIIANTILRQLEFVDKDKIGLTGISWGSVIASIAIGYDDRFLFAIPVYGSGYLYESLAWIKDNFNYPGTKEIWEPSHRLNSVKMPVLWLCWTDDSCFSINSNDKSFADTKNGILSMKQDMQHGHIEGWIAPEIYRFADCIVKGTKPFATCIEKIGTERNVSFYMDIPEDADEVTAKAYYIKEKLSYSRNGRYKLEWCDTIDQEWFTVDCSVEGDVIHVKLPEDAHSYYIELTTHVCGNPYITTSRFLTLDVKS